MADHRPILQLDYDYDHTVVAALYQHHQNIVAVVVDFVVESAD